MKADYSEFMLLPEGLDVSPALEDLLQVLKDTVTEQIESDGHNEQEYNFTPTLNTEEHTLTLEAFKR